MLLIFELNLFIKVNYVGKKILLTGAGFSHNFGAPLANEVWVYIFNHPEIREHKKIKKTLRKHFDFEYVYELIKNDNKFSPEAKQAILKTMSDVCLTIDKKLRVFSYISQEALMMLINKFSGTKGDPGYIFTLNWDLLIERHYCGLQYNENLIRPILPGINFSPASYFMKGRNDKKEITYIDLEDQNEVVKVAEKDKNAADFMYIKLHGSQDWIKGTDSQCLVIGTNKKETIKDNPILKWNNDLFESVLSSGNVDLLIIGYSFQDKHINKTIAQATPTGLSIHVIDPKKPEIFKNHMLKKNTQDRYKLTIYNSLVGYYPYKLDDFFPSNNSSPWKILMANYFNN